MTGRALLPALGVILPPAVWFAVQQTAGGVVYFACDTGGRPAAVLLGLTGVAACVWAGWFGWREARTAASPGAQFGAQLALGLAAVFVLADLVTLAAVWLIPPCAR